MARATTDGEGDNGEGEGDDSKGDDGNSGWFYFAVEMNGLISVYCW